MAQADTSIQRGTGRPTDLPEGEVRKRIIDEAARLFADHGYTGASIQDIVDAAGTTKPMVYYYFQNKEGLYHEIFRTYHEWVLQAHEDILADTGLSTRERLVALAEVHFGAARSDPDKARFMFAAHFGPREQMPTVKDPEHENVFFGSVVNLVQQGIEGGDLSGEPIPIAQALLGQILINLAFHLSEPCPVPLRKDTAEQVVDLLLEGVGRR